MACLGIARRSARDRHDPAASSWGADRLDVFATGMDGHAWHRYWNGTRWVEWARLEAA